MGSGVYHLNPLIPSAGGTFPNGAGEGVAPAVPPVVNQMQSATREEQESVFPL